VGSFVLVEAVLVADCRVCFDPKDQPVVQEQEFAGDLPILLVILVLVAPPLAEPQEARVLPPLACLDLALDLARLVQDWLVLLVLVGRVMVYPLDLLELVEEAYSGLVVVVQAHH
jgi:hypothetical protein